MNRDLINRPQFGTGRSSQAQRPSLYSPLLDIIFDRDMAPFSSSLSNGEQFLAPPVDIEESENEYIVSADLPGVKKEDISIECEGDQLSISAERKYENIDRRQDLQERFYGTYQRRFSLPTSVDADNIDASFENGVLTVCLPKVERAKAKRIEIA